MKKKTITPIDPNKPLAYSKLDKVKYTSFFKTIESKFYNSSDYQLSFFYKTIANI